MLQTHCVPRTCFGFRTGPFCGNLETCASREFQEHLANTWSDDVVSGHRGASAICSCNGRQLQCRMQILALWVVMLFVISGTGHAALTGRCVFQGGLLSLDCALPAQVQALHVGLPYMHRAKVSMSNGKNAGRNRIVYKNAGETELQPRSHLLASQHAS